MPPEIKFTTQVVTKRASRGERIMGALFPSRGIGWPGGWSQDRLEQVLHLKNWTYVAIRSICNQIAQTYPNIDKVEHKGARQGTVTKSLRNTLWKASGHSISPHNPSEELHPLRHDHPLRELVRNPNPIDTSFELLYELAMFMELTGVGYLWVVPNAVGTPAELWVIPSHWVWPRTGGYSHYDYVDPNDKYADRLIRYYEVRPWGGMGSAGILRFPPDEIIMFPWKSPINKIDGYSTLSAIAQWIDTEESISKSRWSQFINQARPDLAIELGEDFEDPTEAHLARIEQKVARKFAGEWNFGKPIVLPPGAKATPLGFNPTEMSYFQSEEQIRDMVLSAFAVPKAVVGIQQDMTYGSILASLAAFSTFAINPRLALIGQRLTKFLAPRFGRNSKYPIRIWWDDAAPPDPQQRNSDISTMSQHGAITTNEIRAAYGYEPYKKGGDDPLVSGPGGLVPLPLNTGEDLTDLAELVPNYSQPGGEEQQGMGGLPGMGGEEGEIPEGVEGVEGNPEEQEDQQLLLTAGIDNPNGPPQKRYRIKTIRKDYHEVGMVLSEFSPEDLDGIRVYYARTGHIYIDVMDWGSEKVADTIAAKLSRGKYDYDILPFGNEQPPPEFEEVEPTKNRNKSIKNTVRKTETPIEPKLLNLARAYLERAGDKAGPDYQLLWWNPKRNHVWWVGFDGDDDKKAMDWFIEQLGNVTGVSQVSFEAEQYPPYETEPGWIQIFPDYDDSRAKGNEQRKEYTNLSNRTILPAEIIRQRELEDLERKIAREQEDLRKQERREVQRRRHEEALARALEQEKQRWAQEGASAGPAYEERLAKFHDEWDGKWHGIRDEWDLEDKDCLLARETEDYETKQSREIEDRPLLDRYAYTDRPRPGQPNYQGLDESESVTPPTPAQPVIPNRLKSRVRSRLPTPSSNGKHR